MMVFEGINSKYLKGNWMLRWAHVRGTVGRVV